MNTASNPVTESIWSRRRPEQVFNDIVPLADACQLAKETTSTTWQTVENLCFAHRGMHVTCGTRPHAFAKLTHYAFQRLCARIQVPTLFLLELSSRLAAANLDEIIHSRLDANAPVHLVLGAGETVRSIFTEAGGEGFKLWNIEALQLVAMLLDEGWILAPSYLSEKDMIVYLIDNKRTMKGPHDLSLRPGVIIENSEVGERGFKATRYLHDAMGHHFMWDPMVGTGAVYPGPLKVSVTTAVQSVYNDLHVFDEMLFKPDVIEKATAALAIKPMGIDSAISTASTALTAMRMDRHIIAKAYTSAQVAGFDPNTVWGMAVGIAQAARDLPFADDRLNLDRIAGRLLEAHMGRLAIDEL